MELNLENVDFGAFGIAKEKPLDEGVAPPVPLDLAPLDIGTTTAPGVDPVRQIANFSEAVKVDPDAHAKKMNLSAATGAPMIAVEADSEAMEQKLKLDQVDFDSMTEKSPGTAKFVSNFDNAIIAQDDIDVMQIIEDTLKTAGEVVDDVKDYGQAVKDSFGHGQLAVESSRLGQVGMWNSISMGDPLTEDQVARLREIEEEMASPIEDFGPILNTPLATTEMLPIMGDIFTESIKFGAGGGVTGGAIGAAVGATAAGAGALPGAIAGAAVGVRVGARVGTAKGAFDLESGIAFNELAALTDDDGNVIDPELAGYGALVVGVINAAAESLGIAAIGGTMGAVGGKFNPMMKSKIRKKVMEALGTETGRQAMKRLGRRYAGALFVEGATEGFQEFTNVSMGEVVKLMDDGAFTDHDFEQVFDNMAEAVPRVAEAAVTGFQASIIPGGIGTAIHARSDANRRKELNEIDQKKIDSLNAAVANDKLKARNKGKFEEFVSGVTGEGNENVYIDGEQVATYLQGKTADEIASDAALQLLQKQAREAAVLDIDVVVPTEKFASEISGTEHFDALRPGMTMDPDAISPLRQEQATKEHEKFVDALIEDASKDASAYVEAQEMYESLKGQLVDTGMVTPKNAGVMAQLLPAWATVHAKKNGISITEAYTQSGLTVEGPQTGRADAIAEGEVLEQAAAEGYEGVDIGEGREWINAADKGLDMSQEGRMTRAAEMGFDTNTIMYHGATTGDINEFKPSKAGHGRGYTFFTPESAFATIFSQQRGEASDEVSPTVYPVILRNEKRFNPLDWSESESTAFEQALTDELVKTGVDQGDAATQAKDTIVEMSDNEAMENWETVESLPVQAAIRSLGYDSFVVKEADVLNTAIYDASNARSVNAAFDPDESGSANLLAQSVDENLIVTHNLSAENILAAADLGGLAAPSLATLRTDKGEFTSFGEVSLLADPSILNSERARTFDSDIYSPRQPRATYDIDLDKFNEINLQLRELRHLDLDDLDIDSMEGQGGAESFQRSTAAQYLWLQQQNKAPKPKNKKISSTVRKAAKLDVADSRSDKFRKIAKQHYTAILKNAEEASPDRAERYADLWFTEEGEVQDSNLRGFEAEVRRFKQHGAVDTHQLRADIDKKMRVKKTRDAYDQWATDQFNSMVKSKKLFKGFTPSGNRKYVDYNLTNVVKAMTQKLQGGEASFYGAGSVRSAYANEMKTIKQVQARRDQIITEEELTKVKDESQTVFMDALDKLKPFYKFDASSWGYADDAGTAIMGGRREVLETFDMTPETWQVINDLTEYLVALPTSYFETKIQRPVSFSEFHTAVVPRGLSSEAKQVLKDAGLKIRVYDPSGKGKTRQQVTAEQTQLLFQNTRGTFDPATSVIRLTEAADLSTFVHEFAHFMYEMELKTGSDTVQTINEWFKRNAADVAKEANTHLGDTTEVLGQEAGSTRKDGPITEDDVVAFLDQTTTGNPAKDTAIRRAAHEQFARGFETYLMEGKAPSVELRNVFRTFARWLTQLYRSLRGKLNVNLDAEMREVFDRLLATEEQIAAAETRAQHEPMFTDATMAGMTEEEFHAYQQQVEQTKDKQTETLRDEMLRHLTNQTKEWWKEEKQDIIDEQMVALGDEPVYRARTTLRDGDIKLDHATVKDQVSEEKVDKLGRKSVSIPPPLRGMTAKGGIGLHPDEAAGLLGFTSGSEMLGELINAPKIEHAADARAQQIMLERHGDVMTDGTLEARADAAVMNEERGKLLLKELKALARQSRTPTVDRATIKAVAEERIGKLSYRETHPGKYRKAEIRAAQESARMLAEGNKEGAMEAKRRQVVNYYLGMEATKARETTEGIVDRVARYSKKSVREEIMKADGGHWGQIVKILNRFEFRKSATLKAVDKENENIAMWAKDRMEVHGEGLVLTPEVLDELYVTHWKEVPSAALKGVDESLKNIEHVARYSNKITRLEDQITFDKLVTNWVDSMDEASDDKFSTSRTTVVEGAHWGRWMMAQMTKIPFMASWLDGGERTGISHQILVQGFVDAYDSEQALWDQTGVDVMNAIQNRSKADIKRHNQKLYIPEIEDNLFGHQVLAVALNTGNTGNLRKMLLGEQWADPDVDASITLDNPQLQAILAHMTKSDWDMVQLIWDKMDELYPQLAEVHRRTTGLAPPKVEAVPVVTPFGEYRGGYYPVKYDPKQSQKAKLNEDRRDAQTESMFSSTSSIQASVTASATSERTGAYDAIRLSLDVVPSHFQETIHYITHHDTVREVNKLINDSRVAKAISAKLGPEEYAQLSPWLNDIAKDGREAPVKMFWDDILGRLRFGTTLGVMGFKASTGIIQISGLSNSIAELGIGPVYQALRSILKSPASMKDSLDFAMENSKVMKHRTTTMDREIKNAMANITSSADIKTGRKVKDAFNTVGNLPFLKAAQETSMKHIMLIQTYMVDVPTWHAAYIKSMSEHGDQKRAYQHADWVIENVQGSGSTMNMARIMRGQAETGRMLTMFMTFFSSLWNMERDLVKGAKSGRYSTTNVASKAMFLFTIPVLFEMMMRGELGEPEDDDDRLQRMLTNTALFPAQSIPFIRDVASASVGEFGYNMTPLAAVLEQGTMSIPELVKRGFTDEDITKGQVKGSSKFVGAAVGVPGVNQAWATGEHLYDVLVEGEDASMHSFLFGPERK